MGRKATIRVSYSNDAKFLLRLKDAVERDKKRPQDWRKKVAAALNNLSVLLLTAPPVEESEEQNSGL